MSTFDIPLLIKKGYRRTSNKYGLLARVDRPDWKEWLAQNHAPWDHEQGRKWVKALGKGAADHYRRCYSKDTIEVGPTLGRKVPNSGWDEIGYVPEGDQ